MFLCGIGVLRKKKRKPQNPTSADVQQHGKCNQWLQEAALGSHDLHQSKPARFIHIFNPQMNNWIIFRQTKVFHFISKPALVDEKSECFSNWKERWCCYNIQRLLSMQAAIMVVLPPLNIFALCWRATIYRPLRFSTKFVYNFTELLSVI